MSTKFFVRLISKSSSGFGEYQSSPETGEMYEDASDLIDAMRDGVSPAEIYELGVDDLPEGLEDIRGKIHNEPDRVFGWIERDGSTHYTGIESIESDDRKKIAAELMRGCPSESFDDHKAIAEAIERGDEIEDLLNMPETNRWPETYNWIKTEIK